MRWLLVGGCFVSIVAMLAYVAAIDVTGEGANIGLALMYLWLGGSSSR